MDIKNNIIQLVMKYPFYGNIFSKMRIEICSNIPKIQIKVYPELLLKYNFEWFNNLKKNEQNSYLIHELLHIILKHPYRRDGRDKSLWSIASDLVVNQFINESNLLDDFITIEKIEKEFSINIPRNNSSEFYYDFILNLELDFKLSNSKKDGLIHLKNNEFLKFDIIEDLKNTEFELSLINKQVKDNIQDLNNSSLQHNKLLKSISEQYKVKELNWRLLLKRYLSQKGKSNSKKSYKRISRRFDNYPGRITTNGFEALIALDESGSMNEKNLQLCIKEIKNINKITNAKIYVTRFDSDCTEPVKLNEFIKNDNRLKKGSTDFRPVFNLADNMKIRTVILFTDGDGICPNTVNQKVLWLLTNNGHNRANFGESINFITEV